MTAPGPFDATMLRLDVKDKIDRELESGERVIWAGQPRKRLFLVKSVPLMLFGIPFLCVASFWFYVGIRGLLRMLGAARDAGASVTYVHIMMVVFALFGVPIVLIGLWLVASPYWAQRRAARTLYALTDRRAIVWLTNWLGRIRVRSYPPEDLHHLVRHDRPDGSGDLIFEMVVQLSAGQFPMRIQNRSHGFLAIDNVREVEGLLRKTLLEPR